MQKLGWIPLIAAIVVATPTVDAHVTTSGAAFHSYNASEVMDIDYVQQGARNMSAASRFVIAPVAFSRTNQGSTKFIVNGRSPAGTVTSFTLWVHRYGVLKNAVSFSSAGGVGFYSLETTIPSIDELSNVSMLGLLPPNNEAVVYAVIQQQ